MSVLSEFVKWASANPLYGFGMLVGLALGVFYGFDGWRGSTEEIELKDSARVKNLVWVLTGAFATIIGDVKAVDPTAQKPVLLLVYCAAVLSGAFLVVVVWGFSVALDNIGTRRRLGGSYGLMDALGDYFFFGYRKYRERKENIAHNQRRVFHQEYLIQLTYSITAAGSEATVEQRIEFARYILRSMAVVVRNYRGGNTAATIRTNLMMARRFVPEMVARLRFSVKGAALENCLVLVTYDSDGGSKDIVLPLPREGSADVVLPGAPAALVGELPTIVDDTSKMLFPADLPHEIKEEMQKYFESKRGSFKSFASLRVVGGGRPIAVVNVDCTEENIFGEDESDKKEIVEYLLPFCSALGILYRGV
jgi:hypothetical protein